MFLAFQNQLSDTFNVVIKKEMSVCLSKISRIFLTINSER